MHLDRRTHRGDPPAWLPAFWSKPGIYPLSPESVSIIKMVSGLPFDRNVTATNTTSTPSIALASTGMICGGQPFFPGNLQPNVFGSTGMGGNSRNMMMDPMQALTPKMNSMPSLLQQQQYQRMLQYQQQQLQAISQSPATALASPSSYTQRKPITTPSSTNNNSVPCLQFASSLSSPSLAPNRKSKAKSKKQPPVLPSSLISTQTISTAPNTVSSKAQRKQVKKSTAEKRRVWFTEDQPQVNIIEADAYMAGDVDTTDHNTYQDVPITTTRNDYYYSNGNHDIYDWYDELEYDSHYYPDHGCYYNNYNDISDVDQDNNSYPVSSMSRTHGSGYHRDSQIMTGQTPFHGDYEDDYRSQDSMEDDYDIDYYNYNNRLGNNQDYYYEDDTYEKEIPRPRSSLGCQMASHYDSTSSSQHRLHTKRRHSAKSSPSSPSDVIQGPQQPQQQQHHSSIARPPISSTNSRMWQPSRGDHSH